MSQVLQPWQLLVAVLADWINEHQQAAIDYLREENSILKQHGIEPAPERGKRITWSQFLKAHWSVLTAADFFTVEVWGPRGLVTFHVFFVIELATRRIEIAGITPSPSEAWMMIDRLSFRTFRGEPLRESVTIDQLPADHLDVETLESRLPDHLAPTTLELLERLLLSTVNVVWGLFPNS